jgi:hypothetical protein
MRLTRRASGIRVNLLQLLDSRALRRTRTASATPIRNQRVAGDLPRNVEALPLHGEAPIRLDGPRHGRPRWAGHDFTRSGRRTRIIAGNLIVADLHRKAEIGTRLVIAAFWRAATASRRIDDPLCRISYEGMPYSNLHITSVWPVALIAAKRGETIINSQSGNHLRFSEKSL